MNVLKQELLDGNKGKSFLLNKLSNYDLPSSTTIRTEGLSFLKYPDLTKEENKNIILLDSAVQKLL